MENLSFGTELLNIITLSTLFIQTLIWLFNYIGLYSILHIDCNYAFAAGYLLFLYNSAQLYCIYVTRLHSTYNNTQFQLSKYIKISLWTAIFIYILIYTLIVYIEISDGDVQTITFSQISTTICWGKPSSDFIFAAFALMSFAFSTITLILFIRPLFKLFRQSAVSMDNADLIQISSKYIVLTFLIIVSNTMAGIGHTILEIPCIAGLSVTINSILIILYEGRFVKYYNWLCPKINRKIKDISNNLQNSIKKAPDDPVTIRRVLSMSKSANKSSEPNISVPDLCAGCSIEDASVHHTSLRLTPAPTTSMNRTTTTSTNPSVFSSAVSVHMTELREDGMVFDEMNFVEHSGGKLCVAGDMRITPRPSSFVLDAMQEVDEKDETVDGDMEEIFGEILSDVDEMLGDELEPSIIEMEKDLAFNAENLSNWMLSTEDEVVVDEDEKVLERIEAEILDMED